MIDTNSPTVNILPPLNVMGIMSGTSVDGIDCACARIQLSLDPFKLIQFNMLGTYSLPWDPKVRQDLLQCMAQPSHMTFSSYCHLDSLVADTFALAAQGLINQLLNEGFAVDLVASHGQTVFHSPPNKQAFGNTLQIGQPAFIAERLGIEVAGDFRPRDMAAGGHGAPLVPFADWLLFQDDLTAKAVQNIGGIANVTVLPPRSTPTVLPFAFDTGPGNMLIDGLTQQLFHQPYDVDGQISQQGRFDPQLLDELMMHGYFSQEPPKSTGREVFGDAMVHQIMAKWLGIVSPEDLVATVTHFTAISIVESYKSYILPKIPIKEVIVGGGGTQNTTLMRLLTNRFRECNVGVTRHETYQISSQYKEALAFALLGYATKFGVANTLPSCTGAQHPVVLGALWPGHPTHIPHENAAESVESTIVNAH